MLGLCSASHLLLLFRLDPEIVSIVKIANVDGQKGKKKASTVKGRITQEKSIVFSFLD